MKSKGYNGYTYVWWFIGIYQNGTASPGGNGNEEPILFCWMALACGSLIKNHSYSSGDDGLKGCRVAVNSYSCHKLASNSDVKQKNIECVVARVISKLAKVVWMMWFRLLSEGAGSQTWCRPTVRGRGKNLKRRMGTRKRKLRGQGTSLCIAQ